MKRKPGRSQDKIKILFINGYGSIEGDVFTLLMLLHHISRDCFDIHVVSKPRGDVYDELKKIPHITIIPMEMGGKEATKSYVNNKIVNILEAGAALFKIVTLVKRERFDVIYTIDRGVAPQLAALVSLATGCLFVLCAAYPFYPQNGLSARFVLRQANLILAHSSYLCSHLRPYIRDENRLVIIPYGIEIEKYNPALSPGLLSEQYGIGPEDPVVVMMGRLNQYKGQDDLIKAANIVLQDHPDTHFLIAGRGPDDLKSYLEKLIADFNIGHRVRLIGYIPSLPQLIAASDIVAMPSWEEPFGLVALEGMAMAKPIVSTKAGGVPEFVINNEAGLLVRPHDPDDLAKAIMYLISHPQRAKEMGMKGRQNVEELYTIDRYVKQVTHAMYALITKSL